MRAALRRHADVLALVLILVLVGGANLFWTAHEVGVAATARQRGAERAAAAQRRAGELVEHKICETLGGLRPLRPPPGNPETNPSRAYLQGLHARFSQLGSDLGCR